MFCSSFRSLSVAMIVAACLAIPTALSAQDSGIHPGGFSLQISGIVRLADTKAPAEAALVKCDSFSGGIAGQVMTDHTGKFSFTNLRPETYEITVHLPGYLDYQEEVQLQTQNTAYINANLQKDRSAVAGTVSLLPNPLVVDSNVPVEAQKEFDAAQTLLNSGASKTRDAIPHLDKAISIYPNYLQAILARGYAYMDLKDWDNAERSLQQAISVNPKVITAYLALADLYRQQKKYTQAEDILKKALAENDQSAEAHYALADLDWEVAPTSKDEAAFRTALQNSWNEVRKAIAIKPDLARAHLLAGNLLLKARRAEDALKEFNKYLELDPKGPFAADARTMADKIQSALAQEKKKSN